MKKMSFEIDGKLVTGYAQIVGDQTWVQLEGRCFVYSPQQSQKSTGPNKQAQKKSGKVVSPMPGKITKILVKLGDQIEANQSLVVMEAMKMEYSLKSQVSGKVLELHCELASQVRLGALLVVIG